MLLRRVSVMLDATGPEPESHTRRSTPTSFARWIPLRYRCRPPPTLQDARSSNNVCRGLSRTSFPNGTSPAAPPRRRDNDATPRPRQEGAGRLGTTDRDRPWRRAASSRPGDSGRRVASPRAARARSRAAAASRSTTRSCRCARSPRRAARQTRRAARARARRRPRARRRASRPRRPRARPRRARAPRRCACGTRARASSPSAEALARATASTWRGRAHTHHTRRRKHIEPKRTPKHDVREKARVVRPRGTRASATYI